MSAHSKLGPSGAKKWVNCPGSIAQEARAGKKATSVYAAGGTVSHALSFDYLTGVLDYEGMCAKVGSIVKQEGHEIEITEEMVDGAVEYLEAVQESRRFFEMNGKPKAVVEKFETKVHATSIDPPKEKLCWGTSDHYIYRKGDVLYVDDYKFGRTYVEVEENYQLAEYAVGVMDSEAGWAFDRVIFRIIQPRTMYGDTTREWTTTVEWIKEWRDTKAKPAAIETLRDDARIVPGEWCYSAFCSAHGSCPVAAKDQTDKAQIDFAVVPSQLAGERLPDVKLLTTEQQIEYAGYESGFVEWFKALNADLQGKAEGGEIMEGGGLVEGRANRKWESEDAVEAAYGDVLGEKLFKPKKIISPAQLEKLTRLKPKDTKHLWIKPEGKKKFALNTDPRKRVATSAQDDFVTVEKVAGILAPPPERGGRIDDVSAEVVTSCPMCDVGCCINHVEKAEKKKKETSPTTDLAAELVGKEDGNMRVWPI